ncbi:hypothetical protein [Bdellovibrio reynosensis]|uniref:Cytochrome c domain-containing protein n=1 Tax=Bdellovibrio reynosensis TaxID=2835041 RepID=A0ABY4C8D4_9BACT|nr:hypothetical protein [Bdellovibrio reynosensis]UOE99940.1 hypothetical protein MNR06_09540 [Bdellovibrio reynosensis]
MKKLILFLSTLLLVQAGEARWNLNDVSYLFPLPKHLNDTELLNLKSTGVGGPLIPRDFMFTIPPLTPVMTEDQVADAMRVVGARIDPCFPLPTPQSCQFQIRLVWQPLQPGPRNIVQTEDAALHSFYVLTEGEFKNVLKDIEAWKTKFKVKTDGLPLQIHPVWALDGTASPAMAAFQKIILKYAGLKNLSRVTVMVVRGAGDMWAFAGFEVVNQKLKVAKIPRVDRGSQAFINFAVPADHFLRGNISPAPTGEDSFVKTILDSNRAIKETTTVLEKELRAMYRIENPHTFNPENMDCVSCHVAQIARVWLENNRPDLRHTSVFDSNAYQNPRHDLSNVSPRISHTQIIRAFGYFGPDEAISQRVINESAAVADALNLSK